MELANHLALRHLRCSLLRSCCMAKASIETNMQLIRRGDLLFVLSLLLATAEPALILFTLGLTGVCVIATGSMDSLRRLPHTTGPKTARRLTCREKCDDHSVLVC